MKISVAKITLLLVLVFTAACAQARDLKVAGLRCEYLVNPLGVDSTQPRLSWTLASKARGQVQTAYQILVASSPEALRKSQGDRWDSGQVKSDQTIQIVYAGKPLRSGARVFWKVRVWEQDGQASAWSAPAFWQMGLLAAKDWQARWIGDRAELPPVIPPKTPKDAERYDAQPATMLRKRFDVSAKVRRATLHASALGAYEIHLNGRRVGDHILAPEWTDYHTRVQYQSYDVTALLRSGDNVIGALLGDGWYAGRLGMSDALFKKLRGVYGRKPYLLAQLEIELANGQNMTVASDGSWVSTKQGPLRSSDILDGEVYDARREMPGWDAPGFDAQAWQPVEVLAEVKAGLVAQPNEPIRVVEELKPVALSEPKPGVFVFDMGQNMVGWCRLKLSGAPGTTVILRHAEMTNADGTIYTANLRGAPQVDRYTLRGGGTEMFEPHFTYHGFRFVEVTGLVQKPKLAELTGRVFCSSSPEVGQFTCSNPMLNRLWQNIRWTQRANLMSVPTDCPQRDERLGWMGDIQAFAQMACYGMDMAAFFKKWIPDVRDAQADDGRYADFSPHPFDRNQHFTGVPAWGDAGVIVPWRAWLNYADQRLIEEHLDSMKRWIDYVHSQNPGLIWRKGRGNDYNDWLNADTLKLPGWPAKGGEVPKDVFATMYFAHSAELVSKMAKAISRHEDARRYGKLFDEIKAAFNQEFVQADGRLPGDTQAGYALALHFNLLPDDLHPKAVAHLREAIRKYNGHLSTGFLSTRCLMLELTRSGYNDEAWQLITNRTFPSWGYMIENGATTMWERWDGYVQGRGFQDPGMNSFNHWAFGSVGEWMFQSIVGIQPDETRPGWKHFVIRPRPGGGVTWANGRYDSIRGPITSAWKIEKDKLALTVTIPVNTSATVYVPAAGVDEVTESGKPATSTPGVKFLRVDDGDAVFEVGSGRYQFAAPMNHNSRVKDAYIGKRERKTTRSFINQQTSPLQAI
ncbi:MAG: glycoside hydrolase family 78 protein [Verrucomicrobia bacterium]|nr:glycoside hydrolase family 78 protein [Verrucomicrobiota bacterium]